MDELAAAPGVVAEPVVPADRRGPPSRDARQPARDGLHGRLRLQALTHKHLPLAAATAAALVWLVAAPHTSDLAAHTYRAWLFDHEGFALWNAQWYGGHLVPGYSLLFPPLAGLLGAPAAVALSGVAAAAALIALARELSDGAAWLAAWLAASAAVTNLLIGRGPFALGVAFGALALLLWARDRRGWAAAAALACPLASPVAGIFLVVVALPRWTLVTPAVAGGLALTQLFPEGGTERFVATAFWPLLALSLALVWLLPRRWRLAAVVGTAMLVAAFALDTPLGQNAGRLVVLAGPPALALRGRGPRWALVAAGAALLYLQWLPAVRALTEAQRVDAAPLIGWLQSHAAPGDRVEIPLTRSHWEAADVAPRFALARGWERQLDVKVNELFYDGALTPERYAGWLRREGIRWVALPAAPLDYSARAEAALLRRGAAFLRPAGTVGAWRLWESRETARDPIVAAGPQSLTLDAPAGRTILHRRHTGLWRVASGRACVVPGPGGRLAIDAPAAGRVVLHVALSGPHCRG